LWLNHAFSSVHNVCSLLREGAAESGRPSDLRILLSHSNPEFVARHLADEFFQDVRLPDDEYADWCLERCRERGVDVLWPMRGTKALAARRDDFKAVGTRLMICADLEGLDILGDKAAFYERLASTSMAVPRHRVVRNITELKSAVTELDGLGRGVCLKPCRSLFGLGFKIITPRVDPLRAFLQSDPVRVDAEEALSRLDVPDERFEPLLVMELLPRPEYSVDCLARDGRLLAASIRRKPDTVGGPEAIIEDESIIETARELTSLLNLTLIFNVQLMGSPPRLLEINPRMAGGLYFSCLAGINYPFWALKTALLDPGDPDPPIPGQRYDLLVNQYYQPFVYAPGA
jgi:carbamoylphosphate synthase large subunit